MAVTKDRDWAWVVCLGAFAAMLLETGTVKALGVLLPVLTQQFSTHTWVIGLSIALMPSFGVFTCPFAGALSKRLSPRFTVMTFSILSTMGLIAGSLAVSVPMLAVSSLIAGFSLGAEAVVIGELATYFDKYYDISIAIARAGVAVGVIIMPILTQYFLDLYGWRGTMMLLGGLGLHLTVGGSLLIPVRIRKRVDGVIETKSSDSVLTTKTQFREQNDTMNTKIIHYLDLTLFRNTDFISMLVYSFGSGYCFTGWLIYLVPHAIDVGFPPYKASLLATIGGVGNLIASFVYPVAKIKLSSKVVLYFASFISSLALAIDPVLSTIPSYVGLSLSSAVFGFGRGMAVLSVCKVLKNTVGENKMTNAVVWTHVTYGVGSMLSGFLSGWIFDHTGNYVVSFLILSALSLMGLCPQFILDMNKCRREEEDDTKFNSIPANEQKTPVNSYGRLVYHKENNDENQETLC